MIVALIVMSILWVGTLVVGVRAINATFKSTMNHLYEQQQLVHAERLAAMEERRQLLERIQRPEYPPVAWDTAESEVREPTEPDWGMVGVVVSEASEDKNE